MFIVYSEDEFKAVIRKAFEVMPGKPVLIDKFLEDAIELDVDCISDGRTAVIGGMLEHIEFAGVHSGDAAMVMPPHTLSPEILERVRHCHPCARARAQRDRVDERPVRHQGRRTLRARGEPAGLAHRAVRGQGHGGAARQARRQGDDRRDAGGTRIHARTDAAALVREGVGLPVRPLSRRVDSARAGNALDRRGDGAGRGSRPGLRQGPGGGQAGPAGEGKRVSVGQNRGQVAGARFRPPARGARFRNLLHQRHGEGPGGKRHRA